MSDENYYEEYLYDGEDGESQLENSNQSNQSTIDTQSQDEDLYNVKIRYVLKEFLSQRNGKVVKTEIVRCDGLTTFFAKIWEVAKIHVKKEIVFDEEGKAAWAVENPSEENMDKFVHFQGAKNKRAYEKERVTPQMLHSWTSLEYVSCNVYTYGALIGSRDMFNQIQKGLILPEETDRSGAAANVVVSETIDALQRAHPDISGHRLSWTRWANYVLASGGDRDDRIQDMPPPNLTQLFGQTRNAADQELQVARRSIKLGKRVNNNVLDTVKLLLDDATELQDEAERHFSKAKRFKRSLESLLCRLESNNNLLDGFGEAIGPEEDSFGADLYQQIEDAEDQDHL